MTAAVVRAAAIQAESVVLDREACTKKACSLIAEAARNGARLMLFPEAFIPVYPSGAVWGRALGRIGAPEAKKAWARLWHHAVDIPGPETAAIGKAARDAEAVVGIGVNERDAHSSSLYNTLLLFGPEGAILGCHRKLVPTNHERMIWKGGDGSTLRVFDTPAGRIGGLICWENFMPLPRYYLYSRGMQIHLAPTAEDSEDMIVNVRNTALEGRVFVVSVCGVLRKSSYPHDFELGNELRETKEYLLEGGSVIVGPDGKPLAGPLWKEEGILYADLNLDRIIEERQLLDVVGHYARPDVLSLRFDPAPQAPVTSPDATEGGRDGPRPGSTLPSPRKKRTS